MVRSLKGGDDLAKAAKTPHRDQDDRARRARLTAARHRGEPAGGRGGVRPPGGSRERPDRHRQRRRRGEGGRAQAADAVRGGRRPRPAPRRHAQRPSQPLLRLLHAAGEGEDEDRRELREPAEGGRTVAGGSDAESGCSVTR